VRQAAHTNRLGQSIEGAATGATGEEIVSRNPAQPDQVIWRGRSDVSQVDAAVAAAREAAMAWARTEPAQRGTLLRAWAEVTKKNVDRIAGLITDEMGKTILESTAEAKLLAEKVDITLGAVSAGRVASYEVTSGKTRVGRCRFKPHGVMAVIGPFNFPAHLPNGHWVPALLAGNAIVFKPSEKTPGVGALMADLMAEATRTAGAPKGVFNLVQGGPEVASRLVNHADVDGILFTGSWPVGRKILEANLDRPGRIVALEMGGNNAAVVLDDAHLKQSVIECVRSAFATSGQRCTCTRRIIVQRGIADRFIPALCKAASTLLVGPGRSETPVFMGPVISEAAADAVMAFQDDLVKRGGRVLVEGTRMDREGWFVTPGMVQVQSFSLDHDREVFGPLAQVCVVDDLDAAIEQANMTEYGLAASIFTASESAAEEFFARVRCGCINWNTGTAGASSHLPFGGAGRSGNHRPAGAFAIDACAYPVANMVEHGDDAAVPTGMMWSDQWAGR